MSHWVRKSLGASLVWSLVGAFAACDSAETTSPTCTPGESIACGGAPATGGTVAAFGGAGNTGGTSGGTASGTSATKGGMASGGARSATGGNVNSLRCATQTGALTVVHSPQASGYGGVTKITPTAGVSSFIADTGMRFCLRVIAASAFEVTSRAIVIRGGSATTTIPPLNVALNQTPIVVERYADDNFCLLFDFEHAPGVADVQLTDGGSISMDWAFDAAGLTNGASIDLTEPVQIVVTRAGITSICIDL